MDKQVTESQSTETPDYMKEGNTQLPSHTFTNTEWDYAIFSLPRSRTAWLANMLNSTGTLCIHSPERECKPLQMIHPFQFVRKGYISLPPIPHGNMPVFYARPHRFVLLKRDHEDIKKSLELFLTEKTSDYIFNRAKEWYDEALIKIQEVRSRHNKKWKPFVFESENLFDVDRFAELYNYLHGEGTFSSQLAARHEILCRMKVTEK